VRNRRINRFPSSNKTVDSNWGNYNSLLIDNVFGAKTQKNNIQSVKKSVVGDDE
jgi:hypothetical protein